MADDLHALEDWAGALLARLQPTERRKLNQSIARDLRRSQQKRIASQLNPDGTAFAPRKPRQQLRAKQGRIKRQMFNKLRKAKYLKVKSSADTIALGFMQRTARLARVHQYGLRDRPGRNTADVQYAKRQLLGFTASDLELIRDGILNHIAPD